MGSRARRNRELDEEIAAHLRQAVEERVAQGESPEEAAVNARREFGNGALVREETREEWGGLWLGHLWQDLAFGLRMLRRSPGFSLLAILCLTIGIGGTAAVFGWIEGVLLRPFPLVADQDRLLAVTGTDRGAVPDRTGMSWPDFRDIRGGCPRIESVIAEKITGTTLNFGDRAERVPGSVVSSNYFEALGVRPILGRGFEPDEDLGRNSHPVTVISYQAWKERFGGDPAVLGKTQVLNGLPHTIVGVAPEGFYGTFVGYAFQFWVPLSMQPQHLGNGEYTLEDRAARFIEGFVRIKPGVTRQQAQEEVSAFAARLEKDYPATNRGHGIRLYPLWKTPFNNAGALLPTLAVALGVVLSVLLIACANVGNLLLVRAFARRREMTVRVAIGAGRGRLIRQLVTEGLILSIIAAGAGIAVARALRDSLVLLIPIRGVPLRVAGTLDWRVLALCAGVSLLSTVLFALVPALLTSRIDVAGALRAETQAAGLGGGRRGRFRVRTSFVLVQMSLSFVLLVGAGLVVRSLHGVRTASPGFRSEGMLTTAINLFTAGYDPPRAKNFQEALIERVRAIPGVESAALSRVTPFSYRTYSSAPIAIDGYVPPPDQQPSAEYNEIGSGYLSTLGIPLLSGREFTRADDETAPLVAIVDETMAARFWPGKDPLGQVLQLKGQGRRIVGVAKAVAYNQLLETPAPFFYVPLRQNFSPSTGLQIRTKLSQAAMAPILAREIHALDSNVSPFEVITMREQLDRKSSSQRVAATILTVFGVLALALAAIGLYGVMASVVSQSSRELAIRTALGARTADLVRHVLSHGLSLTAAGIALGAAAALASTRLLGYLLYKVSPRDPGAFGAALLVMAVASLAACLLPAWRVVRADPAKALRA